MAGEAEISTQVETNLGVDDLRIVTPRKLAEWDKRARIKTGTLGDGVATQIDVAHNWNTRDVSVEVYRNSAAYDTVLCDVGRPDVNTIRFNFAVAPTAAQFKYVMRTGGTV